MSAKDGKEKKKYAGFERRVRLVSLGLVLAFGLLIGRLWYLQVIHWHDYERMAKCNRLHPQRLKAPRGIIYGPDASVTLADNRPCCDLVLVPAECGRENLEPACRKLEELLGVDAAALLEEVEENRSHPYRQVVVKEDVSRTDITRVEEFSYLLPGVLTVVRPQRRYLYGKTAGQILGYLGQVSPDELENTEAYKMGDLLGRDGLERTYEGAMRGKDGKLVVNVYAEDPSPQLRTDARGRPYIHVDSVGNALKPEFRKDPVPGKPIFTTLDIELQAHCEQLLAGHVGAIAAIDADTGAVLALASSPGYDPSVFVTRGHNEERKEALSGKPNPMLNRCYQEAYAPGSTFKILLAAAALQEGAITKETTFYCPGTFQIEGKGHSWRCWRLKYGGHGSVNVVDAIADSCDVFFYNVGLRLGIERIGAWSERIGLGVKTGIDLPREVSGLVPSPAWKEEALRARYPDEPWNRRWYPGDTVNVSIGQGAATATPLQNAVMMAAVLNGGRRVRPYLNQALGPEVSEPLFRPDVLEIVQEGMRKCVEDGTGEIAQVEGLVVLAKTGTAQMVGLDKHKKYETEEDIPYELRDHAWFIAGVLNREPRLAVCALVEHGHHGNRAAGPLAKSAIEHFYASRPGEPVVVARGEE